MVSTKNKPHFHMLIDIIEHFIFKIEHFINLKRDKFMSFKNINYNISNVHNHNINMFYNWSNFFSELSH